MYSSGCGSFQHECKPKSESLVKASPQLPHGHACDIEKNGPCITLQLPLSSPYPAASPASPNSLSSSLCIAPCLSLTLLTHTQTRTKIHNTTARLFIVQPNRAVDSRKRNTQRTHTRSKHAPTHTHTHWFSFPAAREAALEKHSKHNESIVSPDTVCRIHPLFRSQPT